jgi:hypothetical protein
MNCQDFELMAGELAAGRLMDASQREDALAHAASCASCAVRLDDERALTAGFRIVANTANEEAPARVEAVLLAAFREIPAAPAITEFRSSRRRRIYAAACVAAMPLLALLFALIGSRIRQLQRPEPPKAILSVPVAPGNAPSSIPEQQPKKDVAAAPPQRKPPQRNRSGSQPRRQLDRIDRSASEAEIATDFIPLMNREALAQMEGGQLMRVELPRSALMSFGLPMDMERATERIKADLVVGNDGLARAIRFVR